MLSMATFELNGTTFNEGDPLIISAPELGTIEVSTALRGFSRDKIVGLTLGLVKTPLPCRSTAHRDDVNARMELYSNGEGYVNVGVFYCCSCGYNAHNHALEWSDLTIEGNRITANRLGGFNNMPHFHPVVDGYQHLAPRPARVETPPPPLPEPVAVKPKAEVKPAPQQKAVFEPAVKPKPVPQTGQISLF